MNTITNFLELVAELADPNAELNVHGERVHVLVADMLHRKECAATEGNRLGVVFRKIAERWVLVARKVVEDAL